MLDKKARSTDRVPAISDGVFSVAMTLLVLDIKVPPVGTAHLAQALRELGPHVAVFALSFLIVTFYWTAHHVVFNAVRRSDRVLLWVNAGHLLCVVLLVFLTALLSAFSRRPLAVDVYGLNIIACSLSLIAVWIYATQATPVWTIITGPESTAAEPGYLSGRIESVCP
jgi:uncharacterized membrane protein